jgi:hypothetical protein
MTYIRDQFYKSTGLQGFASSYHGDSQRTESTKTAAQLAAVFKGKASFQKARGKISAVFGLEELYKEIAQWDQGQNDENG